MKQATGHKKAGFKNEAKVLINRGVSANAYEVVKSNLELSAVRNPGGIKEFGRHLRSIREAHSLSLKQLGDSANVDKSTLHRIEKGNASPNLDLLISVARVLKLEVHELLLNPAITSSDSGMN